MGRFLTLIVAAIVLVAPFFIVWGDIFPVSEFDRLLVIADDLARSQLLIGLLGALVVLTIAVLFVGKSSTRIAKSTPIDMAEEEHRYAEALALVRDVTSEPDVSVLVVESAGRVLFANAAAASRAGKAEADLIGKSLVSLFAAAEGERMLKFITRALEDRATVRDRRTVKSSTTGNTRMFVTHFYPLATDVEGRDRVLLVDRDVSEAAVERERRRRSLDRMSDLVIKIAQRLDNRTMIQALRISELAGVLAVKLELAPERVETVKIAGRLLGLGRFFATNDLSASATAADRARRLQEATLILADNLKGIDFEGPVVEALRQMHERWDGKGPSQRAGIAIDPTARILSVAAAFLGMILARSDQPGTPIEQAAQGLLKNADKLYERRVVLALIQHLDQGGREIWEKVRVNPEAPVSALTPEHRPSEPPVILSDERGTKPPTRTRATVSAKPSPQHARAGVPQAQGPQAQGAGAKVKTSGVKPDQSPSPATGVSKSLDPAIGQRKTQTPQQSTGTAAISSGVRPLQPEASRLDKSRQSFSTSAGVTSAPKEREASIGKGEPTISSVAKPTSGKITPLPVAKAAPSTASKPPAIRVHATPKKGAV